MIRLTRSYDVSQKVFRLASKRFRNSFFSFTIKGTIPGIKKWYKGEPFAYTSEELDQLVAKYANNYDSLRYQKFADDVKKMRTS